MCAGRFAVEGLKQPTHLSGKGVEVGQSTSGNDKPYENIAISYTKIEVAFKTFDEKGAVTNTDRVNFNLMTSKPD